MTSVARVAHNTGMETGRDPFAVRVTDESIGLAVCAACSPCGLGASVLLSTSGPVLLFSISVSTPEEMVASH